jgi:hypothetical protein
LGFIPGLCDGALGALPIVVVDDEADLGALPIVVVDDEEDEELLDLLSVPGVLVDLPLV